MHGGVVGEVGVGLLRHLGLLAVSMILCLLHQT